MHLSELYNIGTVNPTDRRWSGSNARCTGHVTAVGAALLDVACNCGNRSTELATLMLIDPGFVDLTALAIVCLA